MLRLIVYQNESNFTSFSLLSCVLCVAQFAGALTVNICQLSPVSEAADVLVTTVPTLRTQADFLLPDKVLPCRYVLFTIFIHFCIGST